jgi:hypothetical protein
MRKCTSINVFFLTVRLYLGSSWYFLAGDSWQLWLVRPPPPSIYTCMHVYAKAIYSMTNAMRSQHLRRCDSLDSKRFSCTLTSYGTIIRSLSRALSLALSLSRSLRSNYQVWEGIQRELAREREIKKVLVHTDKRIAFSFFTASRIAFFFSAHTSRYALIIRCERDIVRESARGVGGVRET